MVYASAQQYRKIENRLFDRVKPALLGNEKIVLSKKALSNVAQVYVIVLAKLEMTHCSVIYRKLPTLIVLQFIFGSVTQTAIVYVFPLV